MFKDITREIIHRTEIITNMFVIEVLVNAMRSGRSPYCWDISKYVQIPRYQNLDNMYWKVVYASKC